MIVDPEGLIHSVTSNLFSKLLLKDVDDPSVLIGKPFKELIVGGLDVLKVSRDSGPGVRSEVSVARTIVGASVDANMICGNYGSLVTLRVMDSRDDWFVISFRPCNFPGEFPLTMDENEAVKQMQKGLQVQNLNVKGKKKKIDVSDSLTKKFR